MFCNYKMNSYQKYRKYKDLYKHSLVSHTYQTGGSDNKQSSTQVNKPNEIVGCNRVVYFFDNDANNFVDYTNCICVIPIEIPESRRFLTNNGNYAFTSLDNYHKYIQQLSPGAREYAHCVMKRKGIDSYDPKSGISRSNLDDYTQKIENYQTFRERLSAMIFDWDRTLTVIEGVPARYKTLDNLRQYYQDKYQMDQSVTNHDIVEYYFGGIDRMLALKKLCQALHKYQKQIYVLSANSGLANHTEFFQEMLDIVGVNIPSENLFYKGHMTKYQYIGDVFPNLCMGK